MKTVIFEQGSKEWHDWRRNGLGASDAPIIMGVSPWKTPYQLWLEKTGQNDDNSTATIWQKRGIELEEKARALYIRETGIHVMPLCAEHDEINWLHASFDGITLSEDMIVEIKCPSHKDHSIALQGKIPDKYYPQLQHQMIVSSCDKAHYYSFDGEEGVLVEVDADVQYQFDLMQKLILFWKNVEQRRPPEIDENEHIYIDSDEFSIAARKWKEAQRDLEIAKIKEKEAKENLLSHTDDGNCFGAGVRCTRIQRQGNIDYNSIPELANLDLDKYRKPSIGYWKVRAYEVDK